jgi:hypothetical protein
MAAIFNPWMRFPAARTMGACSRLPDNPPKGERATRITTTGAA